ncbi:hypothetical protein HanIR_Chr10g0478301 [Helianthus annuus]|nr:hypothetical protein HanIR_Chr10g0478301 [Helianthus annuus]
MLGFNSIRWRIKLRTRRKKNRVKRINNEEVMAVSVKTGIAELSCRPAGKRSPSRGARKQLGSFAWREKPCFGEKLLFQSVSLPRLV